MSENGPLNAGADDARAVRDHVADGDVSWLRGEFRTGRLDWLHDHLADGDWAQLGPRLERGDVAWVRRVLGDVAVRNAGGGLAGAAVPTEAVTLPTPRDDHNRTAWLVRTGAAVLLVALASLGLSLCRGSGGGNAAPTTRPAPTTAAAEDTTSATTAVAATTAAPATSAATNAAPATTTTAPAATTTPPIATTTTTAAPTQNLVDTATGAGFSTLGRALVAADLATTLRGTGPFTVLAPTDAAFAKLPSGTLEALLRDRAALTRVLRYHVLDGRVTAAQLTPGTVRTLEGNTVAVAQTGGRLTLNDATVTRADLGATNGLIQVIDTVLLPPGFTVGGQPVQAAPPAVGDVVKAIEADGRFGLLAQALGTAGLTTTLQGAGPYTVFAPTDAAFRALPPELLTKLLADKATLAKILTYHVVAGRVAAAQLTPGARATVEGDTVQIATTTAATTVDGAAILAPDLAATNGLVHGIDRVLVPASVDLAKLGVPLTPPVPLTLSVYFDSDSSALRPEAGSAIADAAKRIPAGAKVALVGVSDPRGNAEANLKLSEARALTVEKAFEAAGLKATYTISAKGSEQTADLALARRVDITAS